MYFYGYEKGTQEKKCPECSTWIAAHTEGPAWFVMCNMCVMMTEL